MVARTQIALTLFLAAIGVFLYFYCLTGGSSEVGAVLCALVPLPFMIVAAVLLILLLRIIVLDCRYMASYRAGFDDLGFQETTGRLRGRSTAKLIAWLLISAQGMAAGGLALGWVHPISSH